MTKPIDMVLFCPACGHQHIDQPEVCEDEGCPHYGEPHSHPGMWMNPSHRSHLCGECGHTWRPADVPTNGVEAIQTAGKNDSPLYPHSAAAAQPKAGCGFPYCGGNSPECAKCGQAPAPATPPAAPEPLSQRVAELEAALRELVEVKALKDRMEALHFIGPNGEHGENWEAVYKAGRAEYIRRQPEAWAKAFALAGTPVVISKEIPKDELYVVQNGEVIGKIVGIAQG